MIDKHLGGKDKPPVVEIQEQVAEGATKNEKVVDSRYGMERLKSMTFVVVVFTIIIIANIVAVIEMRIKYEKLQKEFSELDEGFYNYRKGVELRWGLKEDAKTFVTPNHPDVINKTKEILKSSSYKNARYDGILTADDVHALYAWMRDKVWNQSGYNNDTPVVSPSYYNPITNEYISGNTRWDNFLYPNETLERGKGDCEDWANLLLSMFRAEQNDSKVVNFEIEFTDKSGHVSIVVKNELGNASILDPTGDYISDAYRRIDTEVEIYKNQWWRTSKLDIAKIYAIYSDKLYKEFNSTQEFYAWFNAEL
jgi:hypothetical protein